MPNYSQLKKAFSNTQVVRPPKHRLATFGATDIEYCIITDVAGFTDRARLRLGRVRASKPAILTPDTLRSHFDGFGEGEKETGDWLIKQYGHSLRALEYQFQNESHSTHIDLTPPDVLIKKVSDEFDQAGHYRRALLQGTDKMWQLSIMKFILEETLSSFMTNVQELQDRGFFDEDERLNKRKHREIQHLFQQAKTDRTVVPKLGKVLKDSGLFEQYQDDFFRMVR